MTTNVEDYLQALTRRIKCAHTVILCGGFGRGEGAYQTLDGRTMPMNDVDLVIIPDNDQEQDTLKKELLHAEEVFRVPVEDQWLTKNQLKNAPFTMFNYDLKYGSSVVCGEENIFESMPNYDAEKMPLWESLGLLFNRIAGLLSGHPDVLESLPENIGDKPSYRANQISKALIACGDLFVVINHQYHCNYRERGQRFEQLNPPELSDPEKNQITLAYRYKLDPSSEECEKFIALWPSTVISVLEKSLNVGLRHYLQSNSEEIEILLDEYLIRETNISPYRLGQNMKWWLKARLPLLPRFWTNPRAIVRVELMIVLLEFANRQQDMEIWADNSMSLELRRRLVFGWWHAVSH